MTGAHGRSEALGLLGAAVALGRRASRRCCAWLWRQRAAALRRRTEARTCSRYLRLLWIQLRTSALLAMQYRFDFLVEGPIIDRSGR